MASGEVVSAKPQDCMRVPSTWRTVGGVREYATEVGRKIGDIMDKWSRPGYAIGRRCADAAAEWVPKLGNADDLVAK